jgi:alpha-tubulin suppressor-like RCC1 family protein
MRRMQRWQRQRQRQQQARSTVSTLRVCVALLCGLSSPPSCTGGRVFAVGSNGCGQLGDGTTIARATPVEIESLGDRVWQVAASSGDDRSAGGSGYTLYLQHDGRVLASGYNDFFKLIDPHLVPSTRSPIMITSLGSDIAQMAAARTHSLFLTVGGQVKAVGFNEFGQLGTGRAGGGGSSYNRQPQMVQLGSYRISQVAANQNGYHSIFRTTTGRVLATGKNENGQLGTGDMYA